MEGSIRDSFKSASVRKVRDVSIDGIMEKLFSTDSCERKHAISLLVGCPGPTRDPPRGGADLFVCEVKFVSIDQHSLVCLPEMEFMLHQAVLGR